jgi:hypothetical protein
MITLDSFRKPWLRRRIAEVEADGDRIRRALIAGSLDKMGIPLDSKVGEFTLDHFIPALTGEGDVHSPQCIFDWLAILDGENL